MEFFSTQAFESIGALDMLEQLQEHENKDVYQQVLALIETYFNDVSITRNAHSRYKRFGWFSLIQSVFFSIIEW